MLHDRCDHHDQRNGLLRVDDKGQRGRLLLPIKQLENGMVDALFLEVGFPWIV